MSGEVVELQPAADRLLVLARAVRDDQLGAQTPCDAFTVGDLLDHLDKSARGLGGIAGARFAVDDDTDQTPSAAHLGVDWRDRLAVHVQQAVTAWSDPSAWEGSTPIEPELPNRTWGRVLLTELVVHGWDLAHATGQPFELPDATLQACYDHVQVFVPNAPVPQIWGEPSTLPDDAPLLDRIAAATGRRVG